MKQISLAALSRVQTVVIGDVMLDRYWSGSVDRVSPEAPVPVVKVACEEDHVGGAGNVALNLRAFGCSVTLLGLVGSDAYAEIVVSLCEKAGIKHSLFVAAGFPTLTKLRVLGQHQQLLRLDFERKFGLAEAKLLMNGYATALKEANLVILSDYNKGTLSNCRELITEARKLGKIVLVDPKGNDYSKYYGATLITPNEAEFEAVVGPIRDDESLVVEARALIRQYQFGAVLVTRGAKGMSLVTLGEVYHLPTEAREVYDVTGAGDTVIATLGAALAAQSELHDAVWLANLAAGQVVKKLGTATVPLCELEAALQGKQMHEKILTSEHSVLNELKLARNRGEKIVMTNGCFDILHAGHVQYLAAAKALGNRLIVAVNDDASVSRLKGPTRPVNKLSSRMQVLAALGVVDWVISFSEDTPMRIIELVIPDILVKGGDYAIDEIAGAAYVKAHGGNVTTIPLLPGHSTSKIITKMAGK